MKNKINISVRPYFSFSQMNSYNFNKKQFLETYYYGKFQNSSYLELGKRLATALEYREKKEEKWITDIVKQMPDCPKREFKIEAKLDNINLMGVLDGYCPRKVIITEYKSGMKKNLKSWKNQLLFYSLLLFLSENKMPKKVKLYHAPTFLNENQQLCFCGGVDKYEFEIKMNEILLFSVEIKKIYKEIQKLCEKEFQMFGVAPKNNSQKKIKGRTTKINHNN